MSRQRQPVSTSRARGIWIAFVACIVGGMAAGLLGSTGLIGKRLSQIIFGLCWLLGMNVWHVGVIIDGKIHWRGGPLLASREESPIRFWCIVCSGLLLFNALGLLILAKEITGAGHGQR